jgi:hypothetical protein
MALQTSGFQVPAGIRAPEIPSNIGRVDVKGIYDSVTEGLKSYEALRQMPAQQSADSSRLALATQKAEAEQGLIAPETAARKSAAARASLFNTPQMLQGEQAAALAQRESILRKAAREEAELARENSLVQVATAEEPLARAEILEASKLADYEDRARTLSEIRIKYPWMDLPQYKSLSGVLDTNYKTAMAERERAADREQAMELQAAKGETAVRVAGTRTDPKTRLLDRYNDLVEQLSENPEDANLQEQVALVKQQLNKTAAMEAAVSRTAAEDVPAKRIASLRRAQEEALAVGDAALAEDLGNMLKKYTLPRTPANDMAARTAALAAAFGVKSDTPVAQAPVATPRASVPAVRVTTRGQYDALPSGTDYIDSQGNLATKP